MRDADAAWHEGERAAQRGDYARAEAHYGAALAIDAHHVPSLIGLSETLSRRDAHREAHAAAMRAAAVKPEHPALRYALAQRMRFFQEFEALEELLADPRFVREAPVDVIARGVVMLSAIGASTAAMRMARAAVARGERNPVAWYVLGNQQLFVGDVADAEHSYERCLALNPDFAQASWMLAGARTQTQDSNHVLRLRRQLGRVRPRSPGAAYLGYGLHKELHDLGDHAGAWEALQGACAAKRASVQYAVGEDRALVDAMIARCTPEFVGATARPALEHVPIFIVGMHRSGTTLLERMLAGHPEIGDAGETSAFDARMQLACDHASPGKPDLEIVRRAADADFDAIARGYAGSAQWLSRGKPWYTEKLPMNFWNVGFIARALPQARILHLVRDPMATCFSNLRTYFADVALYSYVQEELAAFYLEYRRMMAHWRDVVPDVVMDVEYQQLVDHPEATLRRICDFCGIDFRPAMLDVTRSGGRVATASAALARQGIRKDRGEVWRSYESWLQPLLRGLAPLPGHDREQG